MWDAGASGFLTLMRYDFGGALIYAVSWVFIGKLFLNELHIALEHIHNSYHSFSLEIEASSCA
jgi:hypothetical protein